MFVDYFNIDNVRNGCYHNRDSSSKWVGTMKRKLSPSGMNTYKTCPAQWNYHYIEKPQGIYVPTHHMDLGEFVHSAIEDYFKHSQEKPTKKLEITQRIDSSFEKVIGNKFMGQPEMTRKLRACLKNFKEFEIYRARKWKTYAPTFIEKNLQDDDFRGIVDFYSEPEATIIDWKTGYKQNLNENDKVQAEVYRYLFEKQGYPVDKVYFVVLTTGSVLQAQLQKDGWILEQHKQIMSAIEDKNFPAKPNKFCKSCVYQIACEFSDANLWEDYI